MLRNLWILSTVAALAAGTTAWAQPASSPEVQELQRKIQELQQNERAPLMKELDRRREDLAGEADLSDLRAVLERAQKAYEDKLAADPAIAAAKQAEEKAEKAIQPIIEQRVNGNEKLQAMAKEIEALRAARPQIEQERLAADRELREARRELESSPLLAADRKAIEAADAAFYQLPRTLPKIVEARKAADAARVALDEKMKALPEKKAFDEATQLVQELSRNSPEIVQAREARQAARQAYEQKVEQVLRTSPKGAAALAKAQQLDQRREETRTKANEMDRQLFQLRRTVQLEDPVIVQARQAHEQAMEARRDAQEQALVDEYKVLEDARRAFQAKLREKMTSDVAIQDLQERMAKVDKQARELYDQLRKLRGRGE